MNKKIHNSLSVLILNDLLNRKAIDKTIYDMAVRKIIGNKAAISISDELVKAS